MFFHGFPGSSAQVEPFRSFVDSFDLDVVCVDRPGYHLSLRMLDSVSHFQQACDLALQLVTSLGWKSCEAISVSGGTPLLIDFAKSYPGFVTRVSIVCGLGPVGHSEFRRYLNWKSVLALRILPLIPDFVFKKVMAGSGSVKPLSPAVLSFVRMLLPMSSAGVGLSGQQVLKKAFEEKISGRSPEKRGNGLKFVMNYIRTLNHALFCFSQNEVYFYGEYFKSLDTGKLPKEFGTLVCIRWSIK